MESQQFDFLEAVVDVYGQDDLRLNDWERGFMKDMAIRFKKYGRDTFISDRQWTAIKKIGEAYDIEIGQF
jgi:hypothetical protein